MLCMTMIAIINTHRIIAKCMHTTGDIQDIEGVCTAFPAMQENDHRILWCVLNGVQIELYLQSNIVIQMQDLFATALAKYCRTLLNSRPT